MFILRALLYLATLPLRVVGTAIALILKIIGIGLVILTNVCGIFTNILSGFMMLGAVAVTIIALTGTADLPNWWIGSISMFVVSALIVMVTALGEIIGDALSDWGGDLLGFSWNVGI